MEITLVKLSKLILIHMIVQLLTVIMYPRSISGDLTIIEFLTLCMINGFIPTFLHLVIVEKIPIMIIFHSIRFEMMRFVIYPRIVNV